MPNGGYPINLRLLLPEVGAFIHAKGPDVTIWPSNEPHAEAPRHGFDGPVALTEPQTTALLFHLLYWGCGRETSRPTPPLSFRGRLVEPQYNDQGCSYAL